MSRIGWASVIAAVFFAFVGPGFAQTNEACYLRCIDHGHTDQYCTAVCTKGVPPAAPLAPNRTTSPAQQSAPAVPAAQSAPPPAAPLTPAVAPSSPAPLPAAAQSAPSVAPVQPPPVAAQPSPAQSAPQPAAAQTAPLQSYKPPPPPINEACYLHCIDHGHLDQYCERVCTVKSPPP